jgi:hypothetical protein
MELQGTVRGGMIVPDVASPLPGGTRVRIEAMSSEKSQTFGDLFGDLVVDCPELPADLAAQHDHYRLGQPKR